MKGVLLSYNVVHCVLYRCLNSQYPKLENISGGWLMYKALGIVDIKKLCTESFIYVFIHLFSYCSFQVDRDNTNFQLSPQKLKVIMPTL